MQQSPAPETARATPFSNVNSRPYNPKPRSTTIRVTTSFVGTTGSLKFDVDSVIHGVTSFVSFSNFVAGTSAIVAGGFNPPPVTATISGVTKYEGYVHVHVHDTAIGAVAGSSTLSHKDTRFDAFLVRAGELFVVNWDVNGLHNFDASFTVFYNALSEWKSFVAA